jgi:DNA-binding NarL/FixJ family response regulator
MDITMPDTNGIEATFRILADHPRIRIIGLSMHTDKRTVREMLKAGAKGYLPKDSAREELTRAIKTVMKGKVYLSPEIAEVVAEGFIYGYDPEKSTARAILSPRELEVLQLLAEGKSTKEIAYRLNVSIKTIETHRKNISEKLGISSVAELTKYALREGLTSIDF